MGIKVLGGYDTASGWPPDDSTGVQFENDVDIPGQFKGGGQGFGPGGFQGSPRVTGPASGPPQGTSLSAIPKGAYVNPATGQPEMLTGPGSISATNQKTLGQLNPFGFVGRGNPYWRSAIAAGGVLTPSPAETGEFNPAMITGRPDAPWGTTHGLPVAPMPRPIGIGSDANAPVMGAGGFPTTYAAPGQQPAMPDPVKVPMGVAPPSGGRQNTTPRSAGPAAVAQQPNLGNYAPPSSAFTTFDRPNMSPQNSAYGRQGATKMGMLDLSRLFGGGAPAAAPAVPVAPAAPVYRQPSIHEIETSKAPGYMGPLQKGSVWPSEMGPKKRKSSTTSQGGGY